MANEDEWIGELREQVAQRRDPWIVLEGKRSVEAAVEGWWDVVGILADDACDWDPPAWSGLNLVRVPAAEIGSIISDGSEHGGILGLARIPDEVADVAGLMAELDPEALVVVCPRTAGGDAAGQILRNAAALGAQAVIFGREGGSPFDREAALASDGALFRMPVRVADGGQILRCLKTGGFSLLGAAKSDDSRPLGNAGIPAGRLALIVGNGGLGSFWEAACDHLLHLPPAAPGESLDSAAVSAIFLWEVGRRRAESAEREG